MKFAGYPIHAVSSHVWDHSSKARTASLMGTASAVPRTFYITRALAPEVLRNAEDA
jgi:hypothetical protein